MDMFINVIVLVLLLCVGYVILFKPTKMDKPKELKVSKPVEKSTLSKKLPVKSKLPVDLGPKKTQQSEHALLNHILKGHTGRITSAAFSPNGRFIATASTDRTVWKT